MPSVSAGHIILTPAQLVGSGWPQQESNPGPPHQKFRALPTELPRLQIKGHISHKVSKKTLFLALPLKIPVNQLNSPFRRCFMDLHNEKYKTAGAGFHVIINLNYVSRSATDRSLMWVQRNIIFLTMEPCNKNSV